MISLHFPKCSCFNRKAEVCQIATPHAQGSLRDASAYSVYGPSGAIPTQNKVTALWPDGSIKWLLSVFEADLPANAACDDYYLDNGTAPAHPSPVRLIQDGKALTIDTGAIKVALGHPGSPVFSGIDQAKGASFTEGEILGPTYRVDGKEYSVLVGENGWKVTQEGPHSLERLYDTYLRTVGGNGCFNLSFFHHFFKIQQTGTVKPLNMCFQT